MSCSVHDCADLESRGVPAVFVASDAFVDAATAQAGALGFPTVARVFVAHPVQDANDDEMRAKAEAVVDEVVRALSAANADPA